MMKEVQHEVDIQGHRGARGLLPENSLAAFLRALELGVSTLEMDVVIARDGEVVLSHDPWFSSAFSALPTGSRVPRGSQYGHRLFEMDYEAISRYDVGLRNPRFPEQALVQAVKPLLRDVIRAAEAFAVDTGRAPVRYNIETKTSPEGDEILHPRPDRFVARLLAVLEDEGVLARSTIQSFDARTLRIVAAGGVHVETSWLIQRSDHLGLDADLAILGFTPDVYSPDYRLVNEALVRGVHARGMRLIPWTVNRPEDIRRIVALGADGIITDYPDVAVHTIGQ